MEPTFFSTPAEFETWLERNHGSASELLVGFYKSGSGRPSISWPQSVDQALRFGWIDGVRKSVDDQSYCIRFTPRRPGSRWSAVNIQRVAELDAAGLMTRAGLQAFAARTEAKSKTYSYEQGSPVELDPELAALVEKNERAAAFMATLAPSYRRKIVHWVMSAKGVDVRRSRLGQALAAFEEGKKL